MRHCEISVLTNRQLPLIAEAEEVSHLERRVRKALLYKAFVLQAMLHCAPPQVEHGNAIFSCYKTASLFRTGPVR